MDAASFTERFDFHTLERLNHTAAERALLEPSLNLGVSWDTRAADAVLAAASGSPYLIQKYGDEAWRAANPPGQGHTITRADADEAIRHVRDGLDAGMFRGRWVKAAPAEQALLVAIAQVADGAGIARTRDITAVLGKTTPQLSSTRKALIDKGIIESAGTGLLQFTMPGFAPFVLEHTQSPRLGPGDPTVRPTWPAPGLPRAGIPEED